MTSRAPAPPFLDAFFGRFYGVRTWFQLDALWDAARRDADGGWFVYTLDRGPPTAQSGADDVTAFIAEVDAHLHKERASDSCGFVYADDLAAPGFIKVFEPKKFSGCGLGSAVALPSWILCKSLPIDLIAATTPAKSWWKKVLHPFI